DFGGTLIFVSHDRYFVDRLATKVIIVSNGGIEIYPGRYEEYLWAKEQRAKAQAATPSQAPAKQKASAPSAPPRELKKAQDSESRKKQRAEEQRARRISDLEARIAKA